MSESSIILLTTPQLEASGFATKIYNTVLKDIHIRLFLPSQDGKPEQIMSMIKKECSRVKSSRLGIEIHLFKEDTGSDFYVLTENKNSVFVKSLTEYLIGLGLRSDGSPSIAPQQIIHNFMLKNGVMRIMVSEPMAENIADAVALWINLKYNEMLEKDKQEGISIDEYIEAMFGTDNQILSSPSVKDDKEALVEETTKKLANKFLGFEIDQKDLQKYVGEDGRIVWSTIVKNNANEVHVEDMILPNTETILFQPYSQRIAELMIASRTKASNLNWELIDLDDILMHSKVKYHLLLIKVAAMIVGFAVYTEEKCVVNTEDFSYLYIHFLCADLKFRGIGGEIIVYIKTKAKELDQDFVELEPIHDGLVVFYSTFGFVSRHIAIDYKQFWKYGHISRHMMFNLKVSDIDGLEAVRLTEVSFVTMSDVAKVRLFFEDPKQPPKESPVKEEPIKYTSSIYSNYSQELYNLSLKTPVLIDRLSFPSPKIASLAMILRSSDGTKVIGIEFSAITVFIDQIGEDKRLVIFIHSFVENSPVEGAFKEIIRAIKVQFPNVSAIDCDVPKQMWVHPYFRDNGFSLRNESRPTQYLRLDLDLSVYAFVFNNNEGLDDPRSKVMQEYSSLAIGGDTSVGNAKKSNSNGLSFEGF